MGSYADDALFMSRNNIEYVELISDDGNCLLYTSDAADEL